MREMQIKASQRLVSSLAEVNSTYQSHVSSLVRYISPRGRSAARAQPQRQRHAGQEGPKDICQKIEGVCVAPWLKELQHFVQSTDTDCSNCDSNRFQAERPTQKNRQEERSQHMNHLVLVLKKSTMRQAEQEGLLHCHTAKPTHGQAQRPWPRDTGYLARDQEGCGDNMRSMAGCGYGFGTARRPWTIMAIPQKSPSRSA